MIIATVIPNNYFAPWDFVKSILQLPPKYDYYAKQSAVIYENRNRVWDYIQEQNQDCLMVDSDMVFTPGDVEKIEFHLESKDIISGVYVLADGTKAVYGEEYNGTRLTRIDACGLGFIGISKRVKLDKNPFNPMKYNGQLLGEDISFCKRLNKAGYKIHCDPAIKVGHCKVGISYYE